MADSFGEARQEITGDSWIDELARASLSAAEAKFSGRGESGTQVTCRHCHEPIVQCAEPIRYCKGWKHVAYLHYGPVGPHYCQGRSINPMAEPDEGTPRG